MMKRILYSNYDLSDNFDETKQLIIDEYPEYCTVEVEDKDGNICYEPDDNKVWQFLYDDDRVEWDFFYSKLKHIFADKKVMMFGTVGRWDGLCSGFEVGTFENLFNDIIKDCDYIEFADDNGLLNLKCSHHDGSNYVSFKLLNDRGYELYDDWEYGYGKVGDYDIQKIFKLLNNNLYSKFPRIAKQFGY